MLLGGYLVTLFLFWVRFGRFAMKLSELHKGAGFEGADDGGTWGGDLVASLRCW